MTRVSSFLSIIILNVDELNCLLKNLEWINGYKIARSSDKLPIINSLISMYTYTESYSIEKDTLYKWCDGNPKWTGVAVLVSYKRNIKSKAVRESTE